ncbi:MAG: histidinol-phosphate transaminase [Lachnospiraceae bacterium]|nr:histidinol-phosphate transaminase [Lachnospiraceae bacterium]
MTNWRKNVRRVEPYVPGEQPKEKEVIKLNTNENPYPPSPKVAEALMEFDYEDLRRYPDPESTELIEALAETYHVKKEQVFVGVGSDDVLAMSFLTFFNSKKPILFPDITYSFYDVWAEEFRIPYETKPLKDDFQIDVEDYLCENGGIVLPNPNAPTGLLEPMEVYERILRENPDSVVIIDEAYVDFGGVSVLPLLEKYENLLVVQTFSKSRCMAGSRIGYAFGNPELIQYLNDVKYSFNSYTMDRITQKIGVAMLQDQEYFESTVKQIIETREWTKQELRRLGFTFGDSKANFIFARHETFPAEEMFQALKEAGIYVRYFKKPRIDNYLRISIGTRNDMEALVSFLEKYVKE